MFRNSHLYIYVTIIATRISKIYCKSLNFERNLEPNLISHYSIMWKKNSWSLGLFTELVYAIGLENNFIVYIKQSLDILTINT